MEIWKLIVVVIVTTIVMGSGGFIFGKLLETRKRNKKFLEAFEKYEAVQKSREPKMSSYARLKYTENFLKFIDSMVGAELVNIKKTDILKEDKNDTDYDKVLNTVSDNVYNAIKKDIYDDVELMVTDEYILSYIVNKTFVVYFQYVATKNV